MSPPRCAGRAPSALAAALVALLTLATVVAPLPAPARAADSEWLRPVTGDVLRPYREPIARFAAGHRGVDFGAPPGAPVRAANDGRVTFAGTVAGAQHVVVAHAGGIRTSYSFLEHVEVRTGAAIRRGDVVGTAGGRGESHGPGVLHLGARIGDRYIDPMLLFGPTDLTELVRLVPADERGAAERALSRDEIRELRELFGDDGDCAGGVPLVEQICDAATGAAEWTWGRLHDALDLGLDVMRLAGRGAAALADELEGALHDLLAHLPTIAEKAALFVLRATPLGRALVALLTVGKVLYEAGSVLYAYATQDCDPDARPANGNGGSGNWVMAVGGIDSARRRARARGANGRRPLRPSFGFEWRRLGYERDDVEWFSYRDESAAYGKRDTYAEVMRGAALLAEQLREKALEHPGRPVDLVGHSLGGRVIRAFLDFYWRGHEGEYPPLGPVVFFASPQNGAPLAGVVGRLRDIPVADVTFAAMALVDTPGPDLRSPALADLDPRSPQSRYFATHPVPAGVKVLTIAGSLDWVVPPGAAEADGAVHFVTNVGEWHPADDHSGILHDDEALRATRAFLEGRKLPCMSFGDLALGALGTLVFGDVVSALSEGV